MNEENLKYLKDSLFAMGFSDKANAELEKQISKQVPEIQVGVQQEYYKDKMDYTLHFKKSDQSDMYFFNRYEATLKGTTPEQDKTQTFYVNKGSGVTAKEACNLLNGRAVNKNLYNKENEKYNAWVQLNPDQRDKYNNAAINQYHSNYGFDLEKALKEFQLKELADPQKTEALMRSLERGNTQAATLVADGKEQRVFVEAAPRYKCVHVTDEQNKRIDNLQTIKGNEKAPAGTKQEKMGNQKADSPDQKSDAKKTKPDKSLLPQKQDQGERAGISR